MTNTKATTTDAMGAAASHVSRNYGDYGYRLGVLNTDWAGGAIFEGGAGDGSRFYFFVDRWGNVMDLPASLRPDREADMWAFVREAIDYRTATA